MAITDILFNLTLWLLNVYKWLNFCVMKLFEPKVKAIVLQKLREVGIQVIVDANKREKVKGKEILLKNGVSDHANGHVGPAMTIHDSILRPPCWRPRDGSG
jgi:hypothetical protein